ncbi:lysophospholipid acyltransferase family protein [Desulfogranum japonicum]|uniref:lysophospholipid acyltransferase family protein n=1 Tax=Desulfogranum japonicum TaxID=231447 RepID=UPI0003F95860|nr:lysophospholipid acyltransferase family protein [Desulfogranum japonicum]
MAEMHSSKHQPAHFTARLADWFVTLTCWTWFTLGFICCFSLPYAYAAFLAKDSETATQKLNSLFFRVLFAILRVTAPSHRLDIPPEIEAIRSSVIVCNHLSYLDPLLLIRTFPRHRTIVKTRFFSLPIFGQVITRAGYIPASGEGHFARFMLQQLETMPSFLRSGGNLFVFPEGTRNRGEKAATFHPGALKIARLCQAPIYIVHIENTEVLFPPGKFLFNSRRKNTITLRVVDRIQPDYQNAPPSVTELEKQVLEAYNQGSP